MSRFDDVLHRQSSASEGGFVKSTALGGLVALMPVACAAREADHVVFHKGRHVPTFQLFSKPKGFIRHAGKDASGPEISTLVKPDGYDNNYVVTGWDCSRHPDRIDSTSYMSTRSGDAATAAMPE
jgi:hypothetical protein